MRNLLVRFLADENAATAIEYAIIAAGIAAVIVAAIGNLSTTVGTKFTTVNNAVSAP